MGAGYGGATAERQRTESQERPAGQAWGGSCLERAGTVETLNSLDLMLCVRSMNSLVTKHPPVPTLVGLGGCFAWNRPESTGQVVKNTRG